MQLMAERVSCVQLISIYANTLRECYEAYVIYNFFMYLLRYLHEEYGDIHAYFSTKEDVPHMWGLQYCMKPWRMGEDFFWECKKVCLQAAACSPTIVSDSGPFWSCQHAAASSGRSLQISCQHVCPLLRTDRSISCKGGSAAVQH